MTQLDNRAVASQVQTLAVWWTHPVIFGRFSIASIYLDNLPG